MRFEWFDGYCSQNEELIQYEKENGISRYECHLYDDDNKEIQEIYFHDYSTKGEVEKAKKNHWVREFAYMVSYCYGYSMSKGFDPGIPLSERTDEDYWGWKGTKEHTVEDIKRWCEEYLAQQYIINYEKELEKLQERKRLSDWFVEHGYGSVELI